MMLKTAVVVLVVLLASVSTAMTVKRSSRSKCRWWRYEKLGNSACDGTCEDAKPACLFTKSLQERCACEPGAVRDRYNFCTVVWRCRNRENLPTVCQLQSLFNSEIKCDKNGLFQRKQTVDGVTKCVVPETGTAIPAKVGADVDCEVMTACQKDYEKNVQFGFNDPFVMDGESVHCKETTGDYWPLQCPEFMETCSCVNPKTGRVISGMETVSRDPPANCDESQYSSCQRDFVAIDTRNYENNSDEPLPVCFSFKWDYFVIEDMQEMPLMEEMVIIDEMPLMPEAPAGN